jgi:NACalpha-BTF3-like transcription factor
MEYSTQESEKNDTKEENRDSNERQTEKIETNVILTESEIEKRNKEDLIKEYYINLQKQKYERFIEIIMNQTTYSREEAIHSLEKHKGDITLVIKEFLGVVDKTEQKKNEEKSKSLHQKRYSVIREYMDNATTNYMKRQEIAKKMNEIHEKQKKAQEEKEAKQAEEAKQIRENSK